MAAGLGAAAAGLRAAFSPEDHELVDSFLRPKIAGGQALPRFIHDADVYSAAPDELVANRGAAPGGDATRPVWYFFTFLHYLGRPVGRRISRAVGGGEGLWSPEVRREQVMKGGAAVGYLQKFSYMVKTEKPGAWIMTGWMMAEYGIISSPQGQGGGGADDRQLVLCKVYRSPRAPPIGQWQQTGRSIDEEANRSRLGPFLI